ncbi:exodeoxyribonuclease I [Roseateles sp. BYS180W]|uniref:Exodeoxyribonuclease I n=1 Tax=Roseateles rivi TaxID=3299028 RepID=A0ABW7FXX9_9BURK
MNDTSFFWHDYETFGRVPRRDAPAQFAGVRTDADLNEIDAPVMVYCQPPRDRLPEPEACLLTGIVPQTCAEQGLPEHEFAALVHEHLARPGTIGVGYNSIRFDDEVTRFLFWRNLLDPYGREWQNGCGRWDLLDVVRCAYALRPEGIVWPRHEDGSASFKLEHLTQANGIGHANAHDALSDVRATIALARLIKQQQPRLWDFCLKLRKKEAVWTEIGVGKPFLHVSGMYGTERGCIALVWPLAPHPTNKNELIVWDLSVNPELLRGLSSEDLKARIFTRQDMLPEGVSRLPIKTIHVNKSPVVIGQIKALSDAQAQRWGLDVAQALSHAQALAQWGRELDGLWGEVFHRDFDSASTDVDEDLYGGFVGNTDRRRLERLRTQSPQALAQQTASGGLGFEDPRLEELVFRFRARNWPQYLSEAEQQRWVRHCQQRLSSETMARYMDHLDALGQEYEQSEDAAAQRSVEIVGALMDWASELA